MDEHATNPSDLLSGPRPSLRLKEYDYIGPLAAHLTFVTRTRAEVFRDPQLTQICIDSLYASAEKHGATIHAYCVMPEHMHVLVEVPADISLTKFARLFKQLSGYRLKESLGDFAWQLSYFDHILRWEESLASVAHYIWQNPVEAGLVARWIDYQWSGPRAALESLQV